MNPVNAWLKRKKDTDEIIRVIPGGREGKVSVYNLMPAYDQPEFSLGRILFDAEGYWMYDGNDLEITEQEYLADFIQRHFDVVNLY